MVCDMKNLDINKKEDCLNPYSIGIWSATYYRPHWCAPHRRLNPYSIGIWSATSQLYIDKTTGQVLILILLEYGLRHSKIFRLYCKLQVLILILLEYGLRQLEGKDWARVPRVLILILLEYGLRHLPTGVRKVTSGLNPYSIGIWSATPQKSVLVRLVGFVLILILLEYGLRQR